MNVIDFGKKIKNKLNKMHNKKKFHEQEDSSKNSQQQYNNKTLSERLLESAKDNVNPKYFEEKSTKLAHEQVSKLEEENADPKIIELAASPMDATVVNEAIKQTSKLIQTKVMRNLKRYFPEEQFGAYMGKYFDGAVSHVIDQAYSNKNTVNFETFCNNLSNLILKTNFFENAFIQNASHCGMRYSGEPDATFDEISDDAFMEMQTRTYTDEQMLELPKNVIEEMNTAKVNHANNAEKHKSLATEQWALHEKYTNDRIQVLKDRKPMREKFKEQPNADLSYELALSESEQEELEKMIKDAKASAQMHENSSISNKREIQEDDKYIDIYSKMETYIIKQMNQTIETTK